jgi:hypothetical protein
MSRDFTPQEAEQRLGGAIHSVRPREDRSPDYETARGAEQQSSIERDSIRPREDSLTDARTGDRTVYYDRDRGYRLTGSQVHTITELGRFRVVALRDLTEHSYEGRKEQARSDIDGLQRKGLVRQGIFEGPEATPRELLTLTRRGHRLVRSSHLVSQQQSVYHGFVKPKEANHDADLYLLFQKEAARIEKQGGRNLRVVLDYELKRKVNRDMARFGPASRKEIAERHGLRVVRQKIPIPDMRIEYETREGEMARVNLELVTEHYRGRSVAEKVHAGFALYTSRGEADHLRRVLDQHELTAEILSL